MVLVFLSFSALRLSALPARRVLCCVGLGSACLSSRRPACLPVYLPACFLLGLPVLSAVSTPGYDTVLAHRFC